MVSVSIDFCMRFFDLFLMPEIQDATQVEDIELSGGQRTLLAIVNFLIFVIGGFIVGLKSAGRTILEPGISAAGERRQEASAPAQQ